MSINLNELPAPEVVEELQFEAILAAMIADYQTRYPDFNALLESDPAYKQFEVAAYREVQLRQRMNDAARAVMLAFSQGTDLDHLAAIQDVARLLVDPGDPEAVPPIDPTYEADDNLRGRVQLAPESQSTAGPSGAYEFHGLSASGLVKDISVVSPAATQITINVLSAEGNGVPSQAVLDSVTAALVDDRKVRPLTDEVTVQAATVYDYNVDATLDIYKSFDAATILQAAESAVAIYVDENHRLGRAITDSGLKQALHRPGVHSVTLNSALPAAAAMNEAPYCTGITVGVGSLIDE
ncbi:baseplate J/gp47 family protein [uncultured Desulfuromusa sp.]|uniref:baseplate assembly protein n=1 Tax=uncultured Desulfuromusa sp. TaxID=219183 RepID=UPI002AA7A29D|nr:baseplate J/gp47 family protein [uncultured Desulfuromusa sp.]